MIVGLLAVAFLQDVAYGEAMRALSAERFGEAWRLLEEVAEPLERHRGRAEVLYAAGDPSGAMAEVEAGLELAPTDLGLIFRGGATAYWLEDPVSTKGYARRLDEAVRQAELADDDRGAWEGAVATFEERARELAGKEEERAGAVGRARWVSLSALIGAAGLLLFLGRPGS